jgi:hypothetical protein
MLACSEGIQLIAHMKSALFESLALAGHIYMTLQRIGNLKRQDRQSTIPIVVLYWSVQELAKAYY